MLPRGCGVTVSNFNNELLNKMSRIYLNQFFFILCKHRLLAYKLVERCMHANKIKELN
jgi:hypothetical protein